MQKFSLSSRDGLFIWKTRPTEPERDENCHGTKTFNKNTVSAIDPFRPHINSILVKFEDENLFILFYLLKLRYLLLFGSNKICLLYIFYQICNVKVIQRITI